MVTRLATALRTLLGRRRFEDSMAEELRFHIEQYAAGGVTQQHRW